MGVLLIVPNLFLGYAYRNYYRGMFVRKPLVWNLSADWIAAKVAKAQWIIYDQDKQKAELENVGSS